MKTFTNEIRLIGNVASQPDQNSQEHSNVNFALAIHRGKFCDFHRIVILKKGMGKLVLKHISKGYCVEVLGSLANRSFEDSQGKLHFRTEIEASCVELLSNQPLK